MILGTALPGLVVPPFGGEVSDPAIKETLNNAETPIEAAQKLIESANESGGADNITAIIIQVSEETPANSNTVQTKLSIDDTQPSILPRHERPSDLPEGN